MNQLTEATQAATGLAYLVQHAPDETKLVEVEALIVLVAREVNRAVRQLQQT